MNYEINDIIEVVSDQISEQMEKHEISSKIEESEENDW